MPPVPEPLHHELAEVVGLLVGVRRHWHEGKGLKKAKLSIPPDSLDSNQLSEM